MTVYLPAGSEPPPSHLTSCTPTKCNLYLDISSATVLSKPVLYILLTVPNCTFIFFSLDRLYTESVQVQGPLWHLRNSLFFKVRSCYPHNQPPNWRNTPCQLFSTAYSIHSQLLSLSIEAVSYICKLRTQHAVVTRDSPNTVMFINSPFLWV
jgi:hypothetical protein